MSAEPQAGPARIADLAQQLETLWAIWDRYLAAVPADSWRKKYGKDWRFEDVPYHMAYYDRVHVIDPIEKGADMPEDDRWCLLSMGMVNAWNARQFAKRPPSQTVEESIAALRSERERLRAILARMTDADLARPAFNHFFTTGWATVEQALRDCRQHLWNEGFELAYRLTGRGPDYPPVLDHDGVAFYLRFLPFLLDTEAAKRVGPFTMRFDITGPAGGTWTVRIEDATALIAEKSAERPDLVLTMSPATFLLMGKNMKNPLMLMLTRKIRVRGFAKMGTFGKLFPPPRAGRPVPPPPPGGHPFVI